MHNAEKKEQYRIILNDRISQLNQTNLFNGKLLGPLTKDQAKEVITSNNRITVCGSVLFNVYFFCDSDLIVHPFLEQNFQFVSITFGLPMVTKPDKDIPNGVITTLEELFKVFGEPGSLLLNGFDELIDFLACPKVYNEEGEEFVD